MNINFRKNNPVKIPYQQKIINKVTDYYHKTFLEDQKLINYLNQELGIKDKSIFIKYKLGYCNGTLYNMIPTNGEITQQLQRAEILNHQAKENYLNCLIMPELDLEGNTVKIKAVKLTDLKQQDLSHLIPKEEPKQQIDLLNEDQHIEQLKEGLFIRYGDRKYLIRGIDNTSHRLKVNIKAINQTSFHIDSIDLYVAKQRKAFAKETALLFHVENEITDQDLNRIIEKTESYIKSKQDNTARDYVITDKDREKALKFLKSPNLTNIILKDFETLGCTGESDNKLIGYLVAISRKLDDPLSLLILSRSAAGKSLLQDSILELIPDEDKSKYTRITGQALFYKGEHSLKHKLIAIEEEEGANQAAYSIRTMQSSKFLTIATTSTDPLTGQMKTVEYNVRGPLSIILTTTRTDIDYETMNRFIITSIDESRQQTDLIHKIQRQRDTLEGLLRDNDKETIIRRHHNAQRLLRPLKVVNPFAEYLTFANDRLRTRRDHKKYLNLIKAITYLYQYQRPLKKKEHNGKTIEYIEVTLNDISFANILANEILGRSLDELAKPSRELLKLINQMVKQMAESQGVLQSQVHFTRRDIREYAKWSDYQVMIHLKQLVDLEYVLAVSGRNGSRYSYELIYDGQGEDGSKFLIGLADMKTLRQKVKPLG